MRITFVKEMLTRVGSVPKPNLFHPNKIEKNREKTDDVRPFRDIPGPKGLPYFGTVLGMFGDKGIENYHLVLKERFKTYGKIFKATIAGKTSVHVIDPEHVKLVYALEGKNPVVTSLIPASKTLRAGNNMSPGLGNSNGEGWYNLRNAVNKIMLVPRKVQTFLPQVNTVADEFIAHLDTLIDPVTREVPDFKNELSKWVLESSVLLAFGKRLDSFQAEDGSFHQDIINASKLVLEKGAKLRFSIPVHEYAPSLSSTWADFTAATNVIADTSKTLLDETLEKITKLQEDGQELESGNHPYTFILNLLQHKSLNYEDTVQLTSSIFEDGLTTTSVTTLAQLYCLANNPKKQQQLYEETCQLTSGGIDDTIMGHTIDNAKYLKACIKEGLRLFPIGVDVVRILPVDIAIENYHIPAGTTICMCNNLALRNGKYFEDPETYLPERWIKGADQFSNTDPHLFLPFSFGPRACIGRRIAEQDIRVIMMKILQKYRLECTYSSEMKQIYRTLMVPDLASNIKFYPRH